MEPDVKTPEQIARDVAETATLSDTQNPETGAYEPVIEDLGQLASFIEDGIRADRAQRYHGDTDCRACGHRSDCSTHNEPALPTEPCDCKVRNIPATSASDRYDAARDALAQADEAMARAHEPVHVGRLIEALRALVEHPETHASPDQIAKRIEARLDMSVLEDYSMDSLSRSDVGTAILEAVHAGINVAWQSWEPADHPGGSVDKWELSRALDALRVARVARANGEENVEDLDSAMDALLSIGERL